MGIAVSLFLKILLERVKNEVHIRSCHLNQINAKLVEIVSFSSKIIDNVAFYPKIYEFIREISIIQKSLQNSHFKVKVPEAKRSILRKCLREVMVVVLPFVTMVLSKITMDRVPNSLKVRLRKQLFKFKDSLKFFEALNLPNYTDSLNKYIHKTELRLEEFSKEFSNHDSSYIAVQLYYKFTNGSIYNIENIQIKTLVNNKVFSIQFLLLNMIESASFIVIKVCNQFKGGFCNESWF